MIALCPHCGEVFETGNTPTQKITKKQIRQIIELCSNHFNVEYNTVISKYRGDLASKARHLSMYFIYGQGKNGISQGETGSYFNRDHSTVINALDRVESSVFTKGDVFKDLVELSPQADEIISKNHLKVAI